MAVDQKEGADPKAYDWRMTVEPELKKKKKKKEKIQLRHRSHHQH
jgi:hypothetical protein